MMETKATTLVILDPNDNPVVVEEAETTTTADDPTEAEPTAEQEQSEPPTWTPTQAPTFKAETEAAIASYQTNNNEKEDDSNNSTQATAATSTPTTTTTTETEQDNSSSNNYWGVTSTTTAAPTSAVTDTTTTSDNNGMNYWGVSTTTNNNDSHNATSVPTAENNNDNNNHNEYWGLPSASSQTNVPTEKPLLEYWGTTGSTTTTTTDETLAPTNNNTVNYWAIPASDTTEDDSENTGENPESTTTEAPNASNNNDNEETATPVDSNPITTETEAPVTEAPVATEDEEEDAATTSTPISDYDPDQDTGILRTLRLYDDLRRDMPEEFTRDPESDSKIDLLTLPNGDVTGFCHISTLFAFTDYGEPFIWTYEEAAALALALQHLNAGDGSLVPELEGLNQRCNMRFTLEMVDTQGEGGTALEHVVDQAFREPQQVERLPCAFVGASFSSVSIPTAIVTGLFGFPQISNAATSSRLDDKSQYPLFGRTIPTDEGNAIPMIIYLRHQLGVKHLSVLNINDAYGNAYVEGMRNARDVYAPDMIIHQIPLDQGDGAVESAVASLKVVPYNYIFMLAFTTDIHDAIMEEAYHQGLAGDGRHQWMFGDSFIGMLDGRTFPAGSPLALSYQGVGVFETTGGVAGMPKYDAFLEQMAALHNDKDLEYLGQLFPLHDHPDYENPPFVNSDDTFLRHGSLSTYASFAYEAGIALGLAACNASQEIGMGFTGEEHYSTMVNSSFTGFSGTLAFDPHTGTRDPTNSLYSLNNWVQNLFVDPDTLEDMVEFKPVNTHLFLEGNWTSTDEVFLFNDGTPQVPPDLPPVPSDTNELSTTGVIIVAVCAVSVFVVTGVIVFLFYENKRKKNDSVWEVDKDELKFEDPPTIIGRGTFGLVLQGEYRGTMVAVKRVIPPKGMGGKGSGGRKARRRGSKGSTVDDSEGPGSSVGDLEEANEISGMRSGMRSGMISGFGSGIGFESGGGTHTSWGGMGLTSFMNTGMKSGMKSGIFGKKTSGSDNKQRQNVEWRRAKMEFMEEMRYLSKLRHPCITTVMGAVTKGEPMLVLEFCSHGSLYDILHNETMALEGELVLSLLKDITQGMRFLHLSIPQVIHGDLKAANILVDDRFRAKVADFGLSQKTNIGGTGTPFWMAPELLRRESSNNTKTDIYSIGIILYEVFSRRDPYEGDSAEEVLELIADKKIRKRPPVPRHMPDAVKALMSDCLEDDPELRPTTEELDIRLRRVDAESLDNGNGGKANVSLFDIFPRHIAEALRDGRTVEPEHKESVTIFFSDIVGFTDISATLDPRKVAAMLDRLYSKFDDLSHQHDIFKVETIGDAYMAVTNLVKDQEDDHAKRIAEFAIDAIKAANETQIDLDDPEKGYVNIRVGFHSGSVVADVVGTRNPRYCLFGDTVNTASRMESNSEVNRIHCSKAAAVLLHKQCPEMKLRSRGKVKIKGKGEMKTYWVNEEGHQTSNEKEKAPEEQAANGWKAMEAEARTMETVEEASMEMSTQEFAPAKTNKVPPSPLGVSLGRAFSRRRSNEKPPPTLPEENALEMEFDDEDAPTKRRSHGRKFPKLSRTLTR